MHVTLFALQLLQVLFLALHDWVPLGRLNDVERVRAEDSAGKLAATTAVSTAPFAFGFAASATCLGHPYPGWMKQWLLVSYAILFAGELTAWWLPYLLGASEKRVRRYEVMFGRTLAFLPERHGIRPNTLHALLHLATVLTLLLLISAS